MPEPTPEPELELELELQPEPQTCKSFVLQTFMAWMDGVRGMEKTDDYTVYSGQADEVETTEIHVYQQQKVCVAVAEEAHTQGKPWYVLAWLWIKRRFRRN